jgi:hypothetical protein
VGEKTSRQVVMFSIKNPTRSDQPDDPGPMPMGWLHGLLDWRCVIGIPGLIASKALVGS